MSSSRFSISPSTGTAGSTRITITPNAQAFNTGHTDLVSTITISDGSGGTGTATVTQWGVPYIQPTFGGTSRTVAGTGATVQYQVYSHYPFVFRSVPDWITIQDAQGTVYTEGQQIPSGKSAYIFNLIVAENSGSTQRTTHYYGMNFCHYKNYTLATGYTVEIDITQLAAEEAPHLDASPQWLYFDYDNDITKPITVSTNLPGYCSALEYSSAFTVTPITYAGSSTISATTTSFNQYGPINSATTYFNGMSGETQYSATTYLVQYYEPRYSMQSNSTIPASGGTILLTVWCPYNWWWYENPAADWITWTDLTGNVLTIDEQHPMLGTGDGSVMLQGVISANTGGERSTELRVKINRFDATTAVSLSQNTIRQLAPAEAEELEFSPESILLAYSATSGTLGAVTVTSNVSWSAEMEDGTYFTLPYSDTGQSGTTYLYVRYLGEQSANDRYTDNIIITTRGGNEYTIPVVKARIPTLAFTYGGQRYEINSVGDSRTITIHSDYPWWFRPSPVSDYISFTYNGEEFTAPTPSSPYTGYYSTTLDFIWAPNSGNTTRTDYFNLGFNIGTSTGQSNTTMGIFEQDAMSGLTISPDYLTVRAGDTGYQDIDVYLPATGNYAINYTTSATGWLHIHEYDTRAGASTWQVYCDQNYGGTRSAELLIGTASESGTCYIDQMFVNVRLNYSISDQTETVTASGAQGRGVNVTCDYDWYLRIVDETAGSVYAGGVSRSWTSGGSAVSESVVTALSSAPHTELSATYYLNIGANSSVLPRKTTITLMYQTYDGAEWRVGPSIIYNQAGEGA